MALKLEETATVENRTQHITAAGFEGCYHFTNEHFDLADFSLAWYILNCVINALFSFVATIANIVVLVAIRRTPSLHSPSNTLLFGLAASDLGVGLIVHPLFFAQILAKVVRNKAVFCEAGIAVEVTANALCVISLLTVTAVGVDRFLALCLHLRYKEFITIKRVIVVLITFWLLSSIFGSLWLWKHTMVKIVAISVIASCLSITSFSYFQIYRIVLHHRSAIHIQQVQVMAIERNMEEPNMTSFKQQAKSTFLVYCLLVVCFTPYLCTVVLIEMNGLTVSTRLSYELTATLIFINSSLNPLVYCWRLQEMNDAVRRTWRNMLSS